MDAASIFRRLSFLEGEWKGTPGDDSDTADYLVCTLEGESIECISELHSGGLTSHRNFRFLIDGDTVVGEWKNEDGTSGKYECEYDAEKDEFIFVPLENPNTYDFRTIRKISSLRFITMEQVSVMGTSSVRTIEMNYLRTL